MGTSGSLTEKASENLMFCEKDKGIPGLSKGYYIEVYGRILKMSVYLNKALFSRWRLALVGCPSRWCFQICFIFTPKPWGNDQI